MSTRTATVALLADPAGLEAGMTRAAAATDAASDAMGDSVDKLSTRTGGAFSRLGSALENLGVPGASAFDKIGQHISEADTRGQKFMQTMSTLGGATLLAGAAGFAAVAVASVKAADDFAGAQAQVQTAVKNSGESFKALQPQIDAVENSMSNYGFSATEAATALSPLIIATGNTKKAEEDLSIAADLARAKHISLSDASSILTKTIAGSTRALTSLGLNLDVGSGKLKTIATDTTSYQNAEANLKQVQDEVNAGALTGVEAYAKLSAAHQVVDASSQKLALDQGTIATILDTVRDKTEGSAKAFGQTLAGQEDIAKAKLDNLAKGFGEDLIPVLERTMVDVADTVQWFEKHKDVSEALAGVIGVTLAGAVATFAVNTGVGMVNSVRSALTSVNLLSAGEDETVSSTDRLSAAITSLETRLAAITTPAESVATAQDSINIAWIEAEGLATTLDEGVTQLAAAYTGLGFATEGATTNMALLGGSEGTGAVRVGMTDAAEDAEGFGATLGGPVAIGIAGGVFGLTALALELGKSGTAWENAASAAESMANTTIPQAILKLGSLDKALDQTKQAAVQVKKSTDDFGASTTRAGGGANVLAANEQALKTTHDQLKASIDQTNNAMLTQGNNLNILSGDLGVSKSQAQSLAQTLSINLNASLDSSQIKAMKAQLDSMGGSMDTAGAKAKNMGANTVAALSQIGSQIQTSLSLAEWQGLGASIDSGVAAGITANAAGMQTAMTNAMNGTLAAARDTAQARSPSRLFAEQVGWPIAQGVAVGITEKAGMVNAATASMLSGALPGVGGISPSYASSGLSGGSSSPVGAGGGSTTVNLQIDGQTFATLMLPSLQTVGTLKQRTVPLSLLGNANTVATVT